ncbi:MAG: hypothetical protein RLZZ297_1676 [Chloroflexota bacterium]|jgi:peptidoglycan/xylan/chitin deacetylase (PgdA/CDA1 family)
MSTPFPWPYGKRSALVIAVVYADGSDAVAQAPDLPQRVKSYSVWQYGTTRGVARITQTLATAGVPSTWYVPGVVGRRYPDTIRALAAAGHEIAAMGWEHEVYADLGDTATDALLQQTRSELSELSGVGVTGFRLPRGTWPRHFDAALLRAGYRYSASLNGDDTPYPHASGLIEIPVHTELDDRPFFQFNFTPAFPAGHSRLPDYDAVSAIWQWEFDAYRQYGGCCVLQVHPEWLGTPGRIHLLEQFIAHAQRHDDVWITTSGAVADWTAAQQLTLPATHPLRVYEAYRSERGQG